MDGIDRTLTKYIRFFFIIIILGAGLPTITILYYDVWCSGHHNRERIEKRNISSFYILYYTHAHQWYRKTIHYKWTRSFFFLSSFHSHSLYLFSFFRSAHISVFETWGCFKCICLMVFGLLFLSSFLIFRLLNNVV